MITNKNIKFLNREMAILSATALMQYFAFQKIFCDLTAHKECGIVVHVYGEEHILLPAAYLFSRMETVFLESTNSWCNTFVFEWTK